MLGICIFYALVTFRTCGEGQDVHEFHAALRYNRLHSITNNKHQPLSFLLKVGKITDPKDYSMQWGLVTCKATKTLYVRRRRGVCLFTPWPLNRLSHSCICTRTPCTPWHSCIVGGADNTGCWCWSFLPMQSSWCGVLRLYFEEQIPSLSKTSV